MRRLWTCEDWSRYLPEGWGTGLCLQFEAGVEPEVRRACMVFARWLRREYTFPLKVTCRFVQAAQVMTEKSGELCSSYFESFPDRYPYIVIAAGDYEKLRGQRSQDNALATYLFSMAKMLSYYFQWIKDMPLNARQANYYSHEIVLDYAETRDHP